LDVAISVGGQFHSYDLCRQLESLKVDYGLFTVHCNAKAEGLSSQRVHNHPYFLADFLLNRHELGRKLRDKSGWWSAKSILFDKLVSRQIAARNPRVLHAWSGFGLDTHNLLQEKRRTPLVIESGSTHLRFQLSLLAEEYAAFGKKFYPNPEYYVRRVEQEFEAADAISVPSQFVFNSFLKMGVPRSKLRLIPYGVEFGRTKVSKKRDDTFRVFFAGGQPIRKGVRYLLEAWEKMGLENSELVILGRGTRQEMRSFIPKGKENIRFIDKVSRTELEDLYSQSSVFCLPSIEEGSARVVYEAMAHGLACVVSENAGSTIRQGKEGFIVPIRSPQAIAEKLELLHSSGKKRKAMGESARRHVRQFTWKRYGQAVAKVYGSLY